MPRYCFTGLLALGLFAATTTQAQIIADPTRAAAARDTLLRQAEQLQRSVVQASTSFTTNARVYNRKRVVVIGLVSPALVPSGIVSPGQPQPVPPIIRWRHVTRYRHNGRVQERYRISVNGNYVLQERRLNGAVTWLSMPATYSMVAGAAIRHRGLYLQAGYVRLDNQQFNLSQTLR